MVVDRDADGAHDDRTEVDECGESYTDDGGKTDVEPFVTAAETA